MFLKTAGMMCAHGRVGDQLCPCQESRRIEHAALLEKRDGDAQDLPRQDAENGIWRTIRKRQGTKLHAESASLVLRSARASHASRPFA